MRGKTAVLMAIALASVGPAGARGKKKNQPQRGFVEKMEAVPCGAKEHGVASLGSLPTPDGTAHENSGQPLCPQYVLRADGTDYEIRPIKNKNKHSVLLRIGREGAFKLKRDRMFLKFKDGDKKMREYKVVSMQKTGAPANSPPSPAAHLDEKP